MVRLESVYGTIFLSQYSILLGNSQQWIGKKAVKVLTNDRPLGIHRRAEMFMMHLNMFDVKVAVEHSNIGIVANHLVNWVISMN